VNRIGRSWQLLARKSGAPSESVDKEHGSRVLKLVLLLVKGSILKKHFVTDTRAKMVSATGEVHDNSRR